MTQTISVAAATDQLQTNSLVIKRFIREGHIPAITTEQGHQVLTEPFSQICQELENRVAGEASDEDGIVRLTPADLNDFLKERQSP